MNSQAYEIVNYKAEHLPRILEITVQGFRGVSIDYLIEERFGFVEPGWEERKLTDLRQAAMAEPEGIFVAVLGDEVVGYVTTGTSKDKLIGRLIDLAVDVNHRRHGLATRLIGKALTYIKEQGMRFAKIETLTTNEVGQVAYPKMGFMEIARQIHYVMPLDNDNE